MTQMPSAALIDTDFFYEFPSARWKNFISLLMKAGSWIRARATSLQMRLTG